MLKLKGYTLIEILVVLLIIATLAALAWPNYTKIKEKSMNREAKASLALIRAAEKVYRLEQGFYYPYKATTSVVANINSDLKLSLPDSLGANWTVLINSPTESTGNAQDTRSGTTGRIWTHDFMNEEPTCANTLTDKNCP
jgi:type IV pilus assembly protein PilE